MIGFIGAMDVEVKALVDLMEDVREVMYSRITFYEGKLGGKDTVVMQSGVGKTAAAITTTIMMENYDIEGIVNFGTAGGLQKDMEVLDVVISDKIAHHDIDVRTWESGFDQDRTCFSADRYFIEVMKQIMKEDDTRVWIGNIVSGDVFVYTREHVNRIMERYDGALCAEMEGAAIAQTCRHYHCPFIVIRSISDVTVREGSEMDYRTYLARASVRSAQWCRKFIERVQV